MLIQGANSVWKPYGVKTFAKLKLKLKDNQERVENAINENCGGFDNFNKSVPAKKRRLKSGGIKAQYNHGIVASCFIILVRARSASSEEKKKTSN
jgi:hypothetical protein